MGEHALRLSDRQTVKIGTCQAMYYLRWDDIDKVRIKYDLRIPGLWFRLPFPDEDDIEPGNYDDFNRGYRLLPYQVSGDAAPVLFEAEGSSGHPGNIQLSHGSGLLLNVACYHGSKLPGDSKDIKAGWNGKDPYTWELYMVKNHPGEGLLPLVRCRHCGGTFRSTWAAVLPHISDERFRDRLTDYVASPRLDRALLLRVKG